MSRFLFVLLVWLCSFGAAAQKGDTIRIHLDQNLAFTTKKDFLYPGIAIKKGDHWMFMSVYPDTGLLVRAYYKNKDLKVKDGPFTFYHNKNVKAMEGRYENNVFQGEWKYWYSNGQLKDSGKLVNNQLTGVWKTWYKNGTIAAIATYQDADNTKEIIRSTVYNGRKNGLFNGDTNVSIKHGNWQSFYENGLPRDSGRYSVNFKIGLWKNWYSNGKPESTGYYTNNIQDGDWEYYRENGSLSTKEKYSAGKIVAMACFDEQGNFTDSFCSILKAPVPMLDRYVDLNNYLLDNIIWPDSLVKNKKIQGVVKVKFTITKEGKLIDFTILSSPHELMSKEVERFFKSLPPWYPAVSHNRAIDYNIEYEVPFVRPPER